MRYTGSLILFWIMLLSCRVSAQQMAMSENTAISATSVYQEIEQVSAQLTSNPTSEELLIKRANLYLNANEYEKALDDIDRGLSLNPKSARLFYTKSFIYFRKKRMDSALESINKAIAIQSSEENLFLRSYIYFSSGDIRKAILDLNSILKINPRADYIYLQKAFWCNDLNMFYEEIKNYLYYIKISKDEVNVDLVIKRLKKIKKADKYYANLIKAAKKDIRKNGCPWEFQVWE